MSLDILNEVHACTSQRSLISQDEIQENYKVNYYIILALKPILV